MNFVRGLGKLSDGRLVLLKVVLDVFLPFCLFMIMFYLCVVDLVFAKSVGDVLRGVKRRPVLLLFLNCDAIVSIFTRG